METIGTTTANQIEVLATYAAPETVLPSVDSSPGWYVVGGFRMPVDAAVRVEAFGCVSDESLRLRVRLFSLDLVAPVSGSETTISSMVDVRELSGLFVLVAGEYQMQVEITGDSGEEFFGSLKTMTVIS